jgi:hypothetical protein
VKGRNTELLIEVLTLDPGIIKANNLGGPSPKQAELEQHAEAFIRTYRGDYEALNAVAKEAAHLLADPAIEQVVLGTGPAPKALAARVLKAHQVIANTPSAETSLMWAERVLGDKVNVASSTLFDAFSRGDADLVKTLRETVLEPALPHVAKEYFDSNGGDPAKAAYKLSLKTTFTMAALRMATVVADSNNVIKAATSSPDPTQRLGTQYKRTPLALKVLWGPGSVYGLYGAVLEIYEGRYINGARYAAGNAAGLATFVNAAAESAKTNPVPGGWQKKAGESLLQGASGQLLRAGVSLAPGLGAVTSTFSLMEHSQRDPSVGNNVSLVGDVAAIVGSSSFLAANLISGSVPVATAITGARALMLCRLGLLGWYGAALIVGGELYQVGYELHRRAHETNELDEMDGLKRVLGLKKKSVVLDDDEE